MHVILVSRQKELRIGAGSGLDQRRHSRLQRWLLPLRLPDRAHVLASASAHSQFAAFLEELGISTDVATMYYAPMLQLCILPGAFAIVQPHQQYEHAVPALPTFIFTLLAVLVCLSTALQGSPQDHL